MFKLRSVRLGMMIGSVTRTDSLMETCEVSTSIPKGLRIRKRILVSVDPLSFDLHDDDDHHHE